MTEWHCLASLFSLLSHRDKESIGVHLLFDEMSGPVTSWRLMN